MALKEIWLAGILTVAAIWDIKTHRIPNAFIVCGWILGLVMMWSSSGVMAFRDSIIIAVLSILILWPVFLIGGIGAGDVKLISVVACFLPQTVFMKVCEMFALLAGVYALVVLVRQRAIVRSFAHLLEFIHSGRGCQTLYYTKKGDQTTYTICLAPVLMLAYLMVWAPWIGGI